MPGAVETLVLTEAGSVLVTTTVSGGPATILVIVDAGTVDV